MLIEWDKLESTLIKALDIVPPIFRSLYLLFNKSTVC